MTTATGEGRPKIKLDLDWEAFGARPHTSEASITFLPSRIVATGTSEQTVFEVGRAAGVEIPTTCGGKGTCARCRVILPAPVRPPTYFEKSFIGAADLARGVRLACRTRLTGDMTVTVLPAQPIDPPPTRSRR